MTFLSSKVRVPFFVLPAAIAVACAAARAADAPPAPPAGAQVIPLDDSIGSNSQAEWAQAWLQWVAAFPRDDNPITDTSGALCAAKQDGEVWFLASSNGTAPITRACVVPQGKALFIPLASTTEARSGNRVPDCPAMQRIAAKTIDDNVDGLSLVIDGAAVPDLDSHRLPTNGCFSPGLRQTPRNAVPSAVADGYYVMIQPLPPGKHTIVAGARFSGVRLSTTYQLEVR